MPPSSDERRTKRSKQRDEEYEGSSPGDVNALRIRKCVGRFAIYNMPASADGKQQEHDRRDTNRGAPKPLV